jgi:acylpyruvate hydrolase
MKIICIGRNYAEHAKELNNPLPTSPVFFMKPETSLLTRNRPFYYPDFSTDIHYETELVLRICKVGKNISERFAHTYYDAIGLGIDFTARDLQQKAKAKGLPWEPAKAFDNSAPISEFVPVSELTDVHNLEFKLLINGIQVQHGLASEMIFSYEKIISYISRFITLKMGDLIFTGTPSGVGPVKIGDRLEAYLGDRKMLSFLIK